MKFYDRSTNRSIRCWITCPIDEKILMTQGFKRCDGEVPHWDQEEEEMDDWDQMELEEGSHQMESEDEEEGDWDQGEEEAFDGDVCFKLDEIRELESNGFPHPADIPDEEKADWIMKAEHRLNKLKNTKGALMKTDRIKRANGGRLSEINREMVLLKIWRDMMKPLKNRIGGRYRQNPRNAYKIGSGGRYGLLTIHMPALLKDHVLTAFKHGKKVLGKCVDDDTIDLLTKRFNARKNYSDLSKRVFTELTELGELPKHPSSMKYKRIIGERRLKGLHGSLSGEKPLEGVNEKIQELESLIEKIESDDSNYHLRPRASNILYELRNKGIIEEAPFLKLMNELI